MNQPKASIAKPNQVLIGESIYNILHLSPTANRKDFLNNSNFVELNLDPTRWKYLSHFDSESMSRVYEYLEN